MHSHHRPVRLSHVSSLSRHPRTLWPRSHPARPAFPHDSRHRMVRGARVRARVAALPRASPTCLIHMLAVSHPCSRTLHARVHAWPRVRTNARTMSRPLRTLCLSALSPCFHTPSTFRIPSHTVSHVILRFRRICIAFSFFTSLSQLRLLIAQYIFFTTHPSTRPHTHLSRIYPALARTSFLRTLHVASHWLSAWWGA